MFRSVLPSAIVNGFAAAVVLWTLWFITHLPWLMIPESTSIPVLLAAWLMTFVALAWRGGGKAWLSGLISGGICSLIGLAVLGSKLRPQVELGGPADPSLHPDAALIVLGFLATGLLVGLTGGAIGGLAKARGATVDWHARFAVVAVIATAPLIFVGGLVTSTQSGMAVPDWPNTFGSNMFLYPLGPRVPASIYLEHSHRLFGTLVGMTTFALMIWTLVSEKPRRLKVWISVTFVFVVVQGLFGAFRVTENSRLLALFHGVSAQVILASLAMFAAYVSASYAEAGSVPKLDKSRRVRVFATAAMHSLLLQLVLGAVYRHFPNTHGLMTHLVFAFVVVGLIAVAGFSAGLLRVESGEDRACLRAARRLGAWMAVVGGVQFALGWAAFAAGRESDAPLPALVRTGHQANGALLIILAAWFFVLVRQIHRKQPAA